MGCECKIDRKRVGGMGGGIISRCDDSSCNNTASERDLYNRPTGPRRKADSVRGEEARAGRQPHHLMRASPTPAPARDGGEDRHGGHEKPRIPRTLRTSRVKRRESSTGSRSSSASSWGSCVQPSIGMPFAVGGNARVSTVHRGGGAAGLVDGRTFVNVVTDGRVVYEADSGKVRLDDREVLGI